MNNNDASVTQWIESLKRGGQSAAQKIWERYYEQLVTIAQRRLGTLPRRAADHDDVIQEAFASFFLAVKAGRFPRLDDRDDLWQVLLVLTDRRTKDHIRRESAESRRTGREGHQIVHCGAHHDDRIPGDVNQLAAYEPAPETVDELLEFLRSRWGFFEDETLAKIAVDKLQGYSNAEIADRNGLALRSTERKLRLIRGILTQGLT